MVTEKLAYALLGYAASRWPNADEMRREWSAELHELAAQGRRRDMVFFAGSLAVSRPAAATGPLLDGSTVNRRSWTVAGALLVAPVVAMVLYVVGHLSAVLVPEESRFLTDVTGEWSYWLQETVRHLVTLALAVGLALLVRRLARGAVLNRPLWLAIAVLVPIVPILGLAVRWWGDVWRFDRAFPELPVWAAGMLLTLWAAGSLARRGKVTAGWLAGIIGALLTAQLAIMTVMRHITTEVDLGYAPLWLVNYFDYRATAGNVQYAVSPTPELYLLVVPYALAFVTTAARQRPMTLTPQERPPPSRSGPTGASGSGGGRRR